MGHDHHVPVAVLWAGLVHQIVTTLQLPLGPPNDNDISSLALPFIGDCGIFLFTFIYSSGCIYSLIHSSFAMIQYFSPETSLHCIQFHSKTNQRSRVAVR